MNHQPYRLKTSLNASRSQRIVAAVLIAACSTACGSAFAQGVATGPFAIHNVEPGPIILIGDAMNPIEIDLDPLAPPWSKSINDDHGYTATGDIAILDMIETILNVGTETWGSWHEHLLPPPWASADHSLWYWESVVDLSVNGDPIGFTVTGLGTKDLWLGNFTLPVQPGDVLEIHKRVHVDGKVGAEGLRIQEYPTPAVPEPASLALAAVSGLALLGKRRRR